MAKSVRGWKFCKVVFNLTSDLMTKYDDTTRSIMKKKAVTALQKTMQDGVLVREVMDYSVADRVYNIREDEQQIPHLQLVSKQGR